MTSDNEIAEHFVELPILYATIRDLTSTLSISQVVERLLERVLVHLDSEVASILLPGPDLQLRITHARGLSNDIVDSTSLSPGEGISGYVFKTAKPLLIADVETDSRFQGQKNERYYTKSAVSVPLMLNGHAMGVLNVNSRRNREPFTAKDLELIEAIGGHAAVALANARTFEQTLDRAQRDSLTGLANHGHLWTTLDVELERAQRYCRDVALVMIDIDRFKEFNDRFGHCAGDTVLAGVARVISGGVRVCDFTARYGGEEFAVLLPETNGEGASLYAERLRNGVESTVFLDEPDSHVTVSMGIASFPDDAATAHDLVEAADERLYRAKQSGRNQICISM